MEHPPICRNFPTVQDEDALLLHMAILAKWSQVDITRVAPGFSEKIPIFQGHYLRVQHFLKSPQIIWSLREETSLNLRLTTCSFAPPQKNAWFGSFQEGTILKRNDSSSSSNHQLWCFQPSTLTGYLPTINFGYMDMWYVSFRVMG